MENTFLQETKDLFRRRGNAESRLKNMGRVWQEVLIDCIILPPTRDSPKKGKGGGGGGDELEKEET